MTRASSQVSVPGLGERFKALAKRLDLEAHADGVFALLAERYGEDWRSYHTLEHVGHCLEGLDAVRDLLQDVDAAELALWFHDAVLEPGRDDNELRSAFLFDRHLGIHLPTARADRVHAMIMATAHAGEPEVDDARYVADIDLSGLAAPPRELRRATELLRRESGHLPDTAFRRQSVDFFRTLLARPSVYLTERFRGSLEERARANIEELIAELGA